MKCFCVTACFRACEKKCQAEFTGTKLPENCLFFSGYHVLWEEIGE